MPKDLDELRERKNELLLESEINRQIFLLEGGQLKLKAADWRHSAMRISSISKWAMPVAGIAMAALKMRSGMRRRGKSRHNGNGDGDGYMSMLAPLGASALKKAFGMWRHARRRRHTAET